MDSRMPTPEGTPSNEGARTRTRDRSRDPLPPLVTAALEPGERSLAARLERIASHGSKKPRYTVLGDVATGGMGRILRAWDENLAREVAMKVVALPEDPLSSAEESADHEKRLERFIEEARITGQLDHPGIVPVHEVGVDAEQRVFFTMPLVRGADLKRVFELVRKDAEGWTQHRALQVVHKVCQTVAFAHSKGVVHRDLKPENIMVGPFGEAYVMDWGLALLLGSSERGGIVGTPAYMAPEQAAARSDRIGPRSDVYSLGAILYELLSGAMPHELSLAIERTTTFEQVLASPPRAVDTIAPDVPPELVAICHKAMATSPDDRYPSAMAMAEDLEAWLEGRVVQAHETGPLAHWRKWRARNRGLSLALDAIALLIVAVPVVYFAQEHLKFRAVDAQRREALLSSYAANLSAADLSLRAHETGDAVRRLAKCPEDLRGWEWRHLSLRADQSMLVLRGHAEAVRALAVHPRGTRVVTGSDDGTLRIWDSRNATSLATLEGHSGMVMAVAFDPDGMRIASGSRDDTVKLWRTATGTLERTLTAETDVLAVTFAPDGRSFAFGDGDGRITVCPTGSGSEQATLVPPDFAAEEGDGVTALDYDPLGRTLFAAHTSGRIRAWDVARGVTALEERVVDGTIRSLDVAPSGAALAVAFEKSALLLDPATLRRLSSFDGHASTVTSVAFDPHSRALATAGFDNVVRVWRLDSSEPEAEFDGHVGDVNVVAFFPDGRHLVSGAEDETGRIWSLERRPVAVLADSAGWVQALAFSRDGSKLASGGREPMLRLWDPHDAVLLRAVPTTGFVDCVAFGPDGELAFGSGDPVVRVAPADSLEAWRALAPGPAAPGSIAFDPSGARIFVRDVLGDASVRDAASGRELVRVEAGENDFHSFAVHPDGKSFATGSLDGTLRVWDARDGALRATLRVPDHAITALAWSPAGDQLAAAHKPGKILFWSPDTGAAQETVDKHENLITTLAFSPDGERLASGSYDHTVRVWNPRNGEALLTLRGHDEPVTAVRFDPSGATLASASKDGTIRLWRTAAVPENPH